MLNGTLEIEAVDYERSLAGLLPLLVDKYRDRPGSGELGKLLDRLGEDVVPVARKLLSYLSPDDKDRVMVALLNANREKLVESANRHLSSLLPITIGTLWAQDREGSRLSLFCAGVEVDYPALLNSPLLEQGVDKLGAEGGFLKGAARLALQMMSPEAIEKQGVALLGSESMKATLLPRFTEALARVGLHVTLRDLVLTSAEGVSSPVPAPALSGGFLPDEVQDVVLDALTAYLRDSAR